MHPAPLRFGVAISPSARPGADPIGLARRAEALGFDLVTVWDHLHGSVPSYETWTLLSWIAAATNRVRIAPAVLGLPYRHPAVIAKMAESLDRLSGGRLILGLGGGGSDEEASAFGLVVRRPGAKVTAQAEAIEILRRLWSETEVTFDGQEFQLRGARIEPRASRSIPIWLGAYGPKALALTGRAADGWIPSMGYLPPDRYPERRDVVRRAAADAGRDPDALNYAYNIAVYVGDPDAAPPGALAGTSERIAEELARFVGLGITYAVFWVRGDAAEQMERLATEVLPLVRASI